VKVVITDDSIFRFFADGLWLLVASSVLYLVVRSLQHGRPGWRLAGPMTLAFSARIAAAAGLSLTPFAASLRGGDEAVFLERATALNTELGGPFSSDGIARLTSEMHEWVFAVQLQAGPIPELTMRITQVTLSVVGLALVAAAVHDLAGKRAGTITAWVLALEPTSLFFSSLLHKESFLIFAGGLTVYGGSRNWRLGGVYGVPLMALGGTVAVLTRPYAGWFLVASGAFIVLHASVRHGVRAGWSFAITAVMVAGVIVSVPLLLHVSSEDSLERLQRSQDANVAEVNSNLNLESVDFSSREKVVTNLPQRVRDVLLRPYPWQVQNLNQQLGAFGGVSFMVLLLVLLRLFFVNWGWIMRYTAPLMYPGVMLLVAYSLSAGNAGTAFRYRTHLAIFLIGVVAVLYHRTLALQTQRRTGGRVAARALAPRPAPTTML
jgi:hypothetical protein